MTEKNIEHTGQQRRLTLRDSLFLVVLDRIYEGALSDAERDFLLVVKTADQITEVQQEARMQIGQKIADAGFTPERYGERLQRVLFPLSQVEKDTVMVSLGMTACGQTPTLEQTASTISRSVRSVPRIQRRALLKLQS